MFYVSLFSAGDPNAYAQYYAQYAQYAQYAAQYQQYAAAQQQQQAAAAAAAQQHQAAQMPNGQHPALATPPALTDCTPTYQSQTQKQYQPNTVQISGLDKSKAPNIKDITDKFGTVGNIKKNQYGQASVRCHPDDGVVTVEYEAASSVESAIKWFNNSEIDGQVVRVLVAPQSSSDVTSVKAPAPVGPELGPPQGDPSAPPPPGYYAPPGYPPVPHGPPFPHYGHPPPPHFGPPGVPPPHGQGPPRPNVPPRPGDWECVHCGNSNFQFRQECRRCKVARCDAEKGKVPPDKAAEAAASMGARPPYRPPFHPGFPPRGPPFMGGHHPGMRPPFMHGGPPRHHFYPHRGQRTPYQGPGSKRKTPYSPSSTAAKEPKTEEKKE